MTNSDLFSATELLPLAGERTPRNWPEQTLLPVYTPEGCNGAEPVWEEQLRINILDFREATNEIILLQSNI